jgi:glyoxylase-like metal-dependent hydrolase (beta-lactamase superfamily II)
MQSQEIAPGIFWLPFRIANVYLLGEVGGPWVVVDSGTPGHFEAIREAAEARYGKGARPEAIFLTHGHSDHAGSATALATYWDVPIYVHRMELPYVTGKAQMPPTDPTVGGAMGLLCRILPRGGTIDLGDSVQALPADGTVPGAPGWRWYSTPGHTPGHVSLFRDRDRVLISGDAVLTVDVDKPKELATQKQRISRPPAATTYDWIAVRKSAHLLAGLRPKTVAAGHGIPMSGPEVAARMEAFAEHFIHPLRGRYVPEPVRFDENGVVYLPPAMPDLLPKAVAVLGACTLVGLGLYWNTARRRERRRS